MEETIQTVTFIFSGILAKGVSPDVVGIAGAYLEKKNSD